MKILGYIETVLKQIGTHCTQIGCQGEISVTLQDRLKLKILSRVEGDAEKKWHVHTAANATTFTTTTAHYSHCATAQAMGIKVKLSRNIWANVERNQKEL